ncbi:restriction endonuclease subunit S [Aerococcus urinaeequi]|uniref:restriction endonuclease subunit S n=1 Tax=Aerococcus urinaeequi TaxID=51665 RepID=UPI003D6A7564
MSINKNSQKIPNLRFKGFTDDWEQRKLIDVADEIGTGKSSYNTEDKSGEKSFAVLGSTSIIGYDNNYDYEGDFILTARVGANAGNLYKHSGKVKITDNTVFIQGENLSFLYPLLYHFDLKKLSFGTGQPLIKASELKNIILRMPSFVEQTKIGSFFINLDNTITLHQRKLDQLIQLKEALLQQMFPGKGETVPKLRFAGFKGDWEELKLGEYTNYRRGSFPQPYGNKEWYGGENAMPFVQVVDVSNNLKLEPKTKQNISSIAQPKSVFVSSGTVVVTLQGSIGRVAITQYDSYVDRTLLIFEDYVRKTDKYFWGYTIQNKFNIEKEKAPGGTIKTITKAALSQFVVSIPLYGEQDKLGTFLKNIDTTITLQQRKLDQLQNMKQVLLENMFI